MSRNSHFNKIISKRIESKASYVKINKMGEVSRKIKVSKKITKKHSILMSAPIIQRLSHSKCHRLGIDPKMGVRSLPVETDLIILMIEREVQVQYANSSLIINHT